jgi:hypothetical protein
MRAKPRPASRSVRGAAAGIGALAPLVAALASVGCEAVLGVDFDGKSLRPDDIGGDAGTQPDEDRPRDAAAADTEPEASACAPLLDCDGVPGCEVDPRTDPRNCGRCNRDCLGGECREGLCTPVPLATNQPQPKQLLLDGDRVCFTNAGDDSVRAVPMGGGSVDVVAVPGAPPRWQGIWGIAADAQRLYIANAGGNVRAGSIVALPRAEDVTLTLAPNEAAPFAIAVNGRAAFFTDLAARQVRAIPFGEAPITLEPSQSRARSIAADSRYVVWAARAGGEEAPQSPRSAVRRRAEPSGPTTVIAESPQEIERVVLVGDFVYFASSNAGTLARVPVLGGTTTELLKVDVPILAMAADANEVVAALANGEIVAVPAAGGARRTLAMNQGPITDMALSPSAVFWTESSSVSPNGIVARLAR